MTGHVVGGPWGGAAVGVEEGGLKRKRMLSSEAHALSWGLSNIAWTLSKYTNLYEWEKNGRMEHNLCVWHRSSVSNYVLSRDLHTNGMYRITWTGFERNLRKFKRVKEAKFTWKRRCFSPLTTSTPPGHHVFIKTPGAQKWHAGGGQECLPMKSSGLFSLFHVRWENLWFLGTYTVILAIYLLIMWSKNQLFFALKSYSPKFRHK